MLVLPIVPIQTVIVLNAITCIRHEDNQENDLCDHANTAKN